MENVKILYTFYSRYNTLSYHKYTTFRFVSRNRQVTSKVYVGNFSLAGKKPTDQRLYASL